MEATVPHDLDVVAVHHGDVVERAVHVPVHGGEVRIQERSLVPGERIRNPGSVIVRCKALRTSCRGLVLGIREADLCTDALIL